jgi:hypothetical protein
LVIVTLRVVSKEVSSRVGPNGDTYTNAVMANAAIARRATR